MARSKEKAICGVGAAERCATIGARAAKSPQYSRMTVRKFTGGPSQRSANDATTRAPLPQRRAICRKIAEAAPNLVTK